MEQIGHDTGAPVLAGRPQKSAAEETSRDRSSAVRQLALPFAHRPRFARADFIAAPSNAAARAWLDGDSAALWPDLRLALWGEAGCGKTHLLQLWARDHNALLLPGTAVRGLLGINDASGGAEGFAIDDADMTADEPALLHLLNAARERAVPVLLAGREPPSRWTLRLPDLASRLRSTVAVALERPEDELLRILLLRLFVERQLAVAQPVVEWLLLRLPRRADAMREAARRLDHAALASGRAVTRGLAATVLERFLAEPRKAETSREDGAWLL